MKEKSITFIRQHLVSIYYAHIFSLDVTMLNTHVKEYNNNNVKELKKSAFIFIFMFTLQTYTYDITVLKR